MTQQTVMEHMGVNPERPFLWMTEGRATMRCGGLVASPQAAAHVVPRRYAKCAITRSRSIVALPRRRERDGRYFA